MLELTNLNYSIKNKVIFKDFNLKINDDDLIFILGSNGCGKSTLLNIINNSIVNNKFNIISDFNSIFYLSDKFSLIDHMDSISNLLLFNNYFKSSINPYYLLEKLMIENKVISHLSKGNRQKVGLAVTLMSNSNLILIDEALDGLDNESVKVFIKLLRERNKAALVVTHDNRVYRYKNVRRIKLEEGSYIEC